MNKAEDVVFVARFPSNSRFLNVAFCVVKLLARSSSTKQKNNSERAVRELSPECKDFLLGPNFVSPG